MASLRSLVQFFFTRIMPFALFCCVVLLCQGFAAKFAFKSPFKVFGQFLGSIYFIVYGPGRLRLTVDCYSVKIL